MMESTLAAAPGLAAATPATTAPVISIRGLQVAYREGTTVFPALNGLDLELRPGEFVAVTGVNGSGKTTLCRLLAGFVPEHIDADIGGTVEFDGRPMLDISTSDRVGVVGYVFDAPYDQLTGAARTVEEEVAFGLENMGVDRAEMIRRIGDALRTVRIEHLAERHPLSLSGGQTQRLALASVLALRPSVLVLDEPTSQLDPLGTREVVEAVGRLSRTGLTVVYVTHDLEPVLDVADRCIVLHDGRITSDGPARETIAALVGASTDIGLPPSVTVGSALKAALGLERVPLTADDCIAALLTAGVGELVAAPAATSVTAPETRPAPTPAPASPSPASSIRLEDVSFAYPNGTQALRDVTLDIAGGCVCFIGQNGSGKSTLMRHLNGLLRPSSGRVLAGGLETAERPVHELARLVAVAFQNPDDQLFNRTVRAEVGYGARSLGATGIEAEERVEEALRLLDLTADAERRPLELGLAARKRVIAASVMAMGSPVVVLDEPTSAQDGPGVAAIERAVRHLVAEGRTAIVVSHDMEFVARTAGRVVALHDGSVLLDGEPRDVLSRADELARTSVRPPAVARIGLGIGMAARPLIAAELLAALDLPAI